MYRNDGGVVFDLKKMSFNLVLKKGVPYTGAYNPHFFNPKTHEIRGVRVV